MPVTVKQRRAPWAIVATLALLAPLDHAAAKVDAGQLSRGRDAYAQSCASCHGAELSGGVAPALRGEGFAARWLSSPEHTRALASEVRSMPKGASGSLPAKTYADVQAFILAANRNRPVSPPPNELSVSLPAPPASVTAPSTAAPSEAEVQAPADADWLMYNRTYAGDRYSPLAQINTANAAGLKVACIVQMTEAGGFEASPVIYKGTGYVTTAASTIAFDAATCARKWVYTYPVSGPEGLTINRGVALYEGALYRVTADSHMIAIDAVTGKLLWDAHVADNKHGYLTTGAPIVFRGLVVIGTTVGEGPGHLFALDAKTGRPVWTFNITAVGDDPGAASWKGVAPRGGPSWTSFAADIKDGLVLAPVGNPAPDFAGVERVGDNLYTDSIVALDAGSGKVVWYKQQLPADFHDWDTAAAPIIYDQDGRRFMVGTSKNGYLYIYDRDSRALLAKTAVTTLKNVDAPLLPGKPVFACPGLAGGVEWNGPAYSPIAKALFIGSVDWCGNYKLGPDPDSPYAAQMGGGFAFEGEARGWIKALDAASGRELWSYSAAKPVVGGITTTGGGLVLAGVSDGEFLVFDAKSGQVLYQFQTGGAIGGGISTYAVDGRQYVAVTSGNRSSMNFGTPGLPTLIVFSLPN